MSDTKFYPSGQCRLLHIEPRYRSPDGITVEIRTHAIPDPRPEPQPTPRIETDPKPLRVPMFDIGDLTKPIEKKKDKPS